MAMSMHRLRRALMSLNRIHEVVACYRHCDQPGMVTRAFLQIGQACYPMTVNYHHGPRSLHFLAEDWEDLTTIWVVLFGGEYRIFGDEQTILDLGANIGVFSGLAALRAPQAKIFAYEPFPATFRRLNQALESNALGARVVTFDKAVSGKPGRASFTADEQLPGHSRHIIEAGDGVKTMDVECVSLAQAIEATGRDEIDLLKMDTEGAEYATIADADSQTLRRCRRVGMEYHSGGDFQALYDRMIEAGFACTRHPKKGEAGVIEFTRQTSVSRQQVSFIDE